jgi:hypothetical protein
MIMQPSALAATLLGWIAVLQCPRHTLATATVRIADLPSELDAGMTSVVFTAEYSVDSVARGAAIYAGAVLTEEQSERVVGISNIVLPGIQGAVNLSIPIHRGLAPVNQTTTCVNLLHQ